MALRRVIEKRLKIKLDKNGKNEYLDGHEEALQTHTTPYLLVSLRYYVHCPIPTLKLIRECFKFTEHEKYLVI